MKQLCILLPVYEAKDRVEIFIDTIHDYCEKNGIDIYLCDSSPNNSIELLVNKYRSNILYYMDKRKEPQRKLIEAFKTLSKTYEYIWLQSDGRIVKIEELLIDSKEYLNSHIDIIHFGNYLSDYEKSTGKRQIEYTDPNEFYINNVWYMTCFGASIVSSRLMSYIDWDEITKRYSSSFFYVMGIYEACSRSNFAAIHISKEWYIDNPLRVGAGSVRRGDVLVTYGKNWTIDNLALPNKYEPDKMRAIMSLDDNAHFFGIRCMLKWRIYDNFTIKKIKTYRDYIPRFTKTPVWVFYCVACVPKFLLKMYWKATGSKPM